MTVQLSESKGKLSHPSNENPIDNSSILYIPLYVLHLLVLLKFGQLISKLCSHLAFSFGMSGSYLPPITELSSSESEPIGPPVKRPKRVKGSGSAPIESHGSTQQPSRTVRALFGQLCQCSKGRKDGSGSCFLKFKDAPEKLEEVRDQFQSLHKLDQDQLETWLCLTVYLQLSCFYMIYHECLTTSGFKTTPKNNTIDTPLPCTSGLRYSSASSMESHRVQPHKCQCRSIQSEALGFADQHGNPSWGLEPGCPLASMFL